MQLRKPSYEILDPLDRVQILKKLEICGRVCYKSEHAITNDSYQSFIKMITTRNHESVLEHAHIGVRFICNRGFSHELVRHRLASFSQESTRYCNYSKDKFDNQITFIIPSGYTEWTKLSQDEWYYAMESAEGRYLDMIKGGSNPQDARGVLPIDLKTEIIMTTNLRHWAHVFSLRCSPAAHPSMKELMIPLRNEFEKTLPEIFCRQLTFKAPF